MHCPPAKSAVYWCAQLYVRHDDHAVVLAHLNSFRLPAAAWECIQVSPTRKRAEGAPCAGVSKPLKRRPHYHSSSLAVTAHTQTCSPLLGLPQTVQVLEHMQAASCAHSVHLTRVVHVQRVNFSYLDAGALKRLGQFYNVPEANYGCSLDELAYAVASAFTQDVWLSALLSTLLPIPL